ncbi:hypothetical protein QCA50_012563 [Cerrena zonata]|uniref:Uncharacterized protein n=1 Tax=Cerrena zonata TaxID=2478898 RepID=A0AAW0FXV5_9APHY
MEIDISQDFVTDQEVDDHSASPTHDFMHVPTLDDNSLPDVHLTHLRVPQLEQYELKSCFMTLSSLEPLTTALKIRYGATLSPIIGPPLSFHQALNHFNEEIHGPLSSENAHAIAHFVAAVMASKERAHVPPTVSDLSTLSRVPNVNFVTRIATCPSDPASILYAVECRDSKELGLHLLAYDSITLNQIFRHGSTDVAPLAESLMRRGCKFGLLCPNLHLSPQIPPTPSLTTSFRARHHTFSHDDYASYALTRYRRIIIWRHTVSSRNRKCSATGAVQHVP